MSRLIDADKLYPDRMTNKGTVAISQSQIAKAPTIHAIPIDKVKKTREEISDWDVNKVMDGCSEPFRLGVAKGLDIASVILGKLIAESEKTESEEEDAPF